MSRPGRRPRPTAGRPAAGGRAAGSPGGRPDRGTTHGRGTTPEPVPLERGRAFGILAGLFCFTAGFAVAAVDLFVWGFTRPPYLVAVTVGFVGIGVVGFFLNRGTVPRPEAPLWSPTGIRALARAVGWPATPVMAVVYALALVGVVGNFVVPLFFRR
jgi:hypothetical protein